MMWRSSSRCEGGDCLEVSLPAWRKASRSFENSSCVEVVAAEGAVLVRDSKDPDGPVLRFDRQEWRAFVAGVKAGEFDG